MKQPLIKYSRKKELFAVEVLVIREVTVRLKTTVVAHQEVRVDATIPSVKADLERIFH